MEGGYQGEKEPEPKPVFTEKQKKWAKDFLTTPSPIQQNLPDDYGREFRRQVAILEKAMAEKKALEEKEKKALEEKKEASKKCGKQVSQLGEQKKQSIPPANSGSRYFPDGVLQSRYG